jgi:uncharacterized protein with ATP-grasp and redox domains
MTRRIPDILAQVMTDHQASYPPEIKAALQVLYHELTTNQTIAPVETIAPDRAAWHAAWQEQRGRGWLDIPWYFAEAFFYRRLLEAVNYFGGHGPQLQPWVSLDPFLPRKREELQSDTPWQVLAAALAHAAADPVDRFRALLHYAVWGNRIDLSYNQVAETSGRQIAVEREQANLLVDDTEAVAGYLRQGSGGAGKSAKGTKGERGSVRSFPQGRVDFICDNAGTELLLDLALADFLLRFDWAGQVSLHVKAHPTFVSDATLADVDLTIAAIRQQGGSELSELAGRLSAQRLQGRLQTKAHIFWNSSRFLWEMPAGLRSELAQARLVILKGDANYRRLLGDSRWPATTPLADAVPYFPAPFVVLRTLKSEPIVGLATGLAEKLDREDAEWHVNGKRGLIQSNW